MKILNRTATLLLCASLASVYGALLPEATKIRQRLGNFSAPEYVPIVRTESKH